MLINSNGVINLALIRETDEGAVTVEFTDMSVEELRQRIVFPEAIAELVARDLDGEYRAVRVSNVERRIIKDSIHCKQCTENNDPNNVPVHPNCQCNVITDSVESGVADPTSRFFSPLETAKTAIELFGEGELPTSIQLNPETVSILDPENVRFADLARWLEQMEPYLDQGAQYLSIVVDDDTDEAVQQVQETVETVASGIEDIPEALRHRKLWFALAKSVVF